MIYIYIYIYIFFLLNLIIIVIKKIVQPELPTHVGWIELGLVEFFLIHHGGLGQKIPSTRPNLTYAHP